MSQYNNGIRAFTASGALSQYQRVKITAGSTTTPPQVEASGADEAYVGWVVNDAADGAIVSVSIIYKNGTTQGIATDAIAVGAAVYAGATGSIASSGSTALGYALEASTANGDIIEIVEV